MELTSFNHGYGQNAQHFVFVSKYRYNIFSYEQIRVACYAILIDIANRYKFQVHELRVMPDHVHLFVELPPTISVSRAIQLFKGISSRVLFMLFPWITRWYKRRHFWTAGKFYRSVGNVTAETIEHYIRESQG